MDTVHALRLEYLCAQKDAVIAAQAADLAALRATQIVAQLRCALGASPEATWQEATYSFIEPPATAEPPAPPADETPTEVVV